MTSFSTDMPNANAADDSAADDSAANDDNAASDSTTPRRQLGRTGFAVHPIAIDGSVFGWAAGHDETAAVLDIFAEAGGNLITTADHYAGGRSEVMIGHWLATRGKREEVVLATKVGRHPDASGLGAAAITAAVDASLERFGTDRIDILALDGEHPETPAEETLGAVAELVAAGKVRALAASAYSGPRIEHFQDVARENGTGGIDVIIAQYNLMERATYEFDVAPLAVALGNATIARLPLANGFLTGRYRSLDDLPTSGMYADAARHIGRRGAHVLGAMEGVAAELGEPLARVAIAWVLTRPGIAATAIRARDADQAVDFLESARISLSDGQVESLNAASA